MKIEECDVSKLVDLLFERNKIRVRLSLKSSPKDGYLIDYDGKYNKYFGFHNFKTLIEQTGII